MPRESDLRRNPHRFGSTSDLASQASWTWPSCSATKPPTRHFRQTRLPTNDGKLQQVGKHGDLNIGREDHQLSDQRSPLKETMTIHMVRACLLEAPICSNQVVQGLIGEAAEAYCRSQAGIPQLQLVERSLSSRRSGYCCGGALISRTWGLQPDRQISTPMGQEYLGVKPVPPRRGCARKTACSPMWPGCERCRDGQIWATQTLSKT